MVLALEFLVPKFWALCATFALLRSQRHNHQRLMNQFKTHTGTSIDEAASWLRQGELVAIPTETVYGLAANAFSPVAIEKVFTTKRRPASNPLIVHTNDIQKVRNWVTDLPEAAVKLVSAFSPGPLTVLLPTNGLLPSAVNCGRAEVAFRIPNHPLTLALLGQLDFPLVAPSANLFGTVSPTEPAHVLKNFDGQIPYILDGGPCPVGIESTVVGFDAAGLPVIYRHGAVTAEAIRRVAGSVSEKVKGPDTVAPGMLPYHYSPKTPLRFGEEVDVAQVPDRNRAGAIRFQSYHALLPVENQFVLSPAGSLEEAAQNLYKALHTLDDLGLQLIYAERLPDEGLGIALNDRLQKAANQFEIKK